MSNPIMMPEKSNDMMESAPIESYADSYANAPEEWRDFKNTFEKVQNELYEKRKKLSDEENRVIFGRMRAKWKESFKSVPKPGKYLTYHMVLGGGTGPVSSPKLDFEGEYSLLEFYKKLIQELDT